jgi:hypothetical protein
VRSIVEMVLKYRPQNKIDGIRNIWILKPGDNSLGRGIVLKSRLIDILAKVKQTTRDSSQYVIQKYIGISSFLITKINKYHEGITVTAITL